MVARAGKKQGCARARSDWPRAARTSLSTSIRAGFFRGAVKRNADTGDKGTRRFLDTDRAGDGSFCERFFSTDD